jgi:hypothetical protein
MEREFPAGIVWSEDRPIEDASGGTSAERDQHLLGFVAGQVRAANDGESIPGDAKEWLRSISAQRMLGDEAWEVARQDRFARSRSGAWRRVSVFD